MRKRDRRVRGEFGEGDGGDVLDLGEVGDEVGEAFVGGAVGEHVEAPKDVLDGPGDFVAFESKRETSDREVLEVLEKGDDVVEGSRDRRSVVSRVAPRLEGQLLQDVCRVFLVDECEFEEVVTRGRDGRREKDVVQERKPLARFLVLSTSRLFEAFSSRE